MTAAILHTDALKIGATVGSSHGNSGYVATEGECVLSKDEVARAMEMAEQLGQVFYKKLFSQTPEFSSIFTQPNQSSTVRGQPRLFVKAIIHFAELIASGKFDPEDDDQDEDDVIEALVQKHRALMVEPSFYPKIGAGFLEAVAQFPELGSINAWSGVYREFAKYLMKQADLIDMANRQAPGGWNGYRKLRIAEKYSESSDTISLSLKPLVDDPNQDILLPEPGQYLGLRFDFGSGVEFRKQYSISNYVDGDTKNYLITVKREPGGVVSKFIHDELKLGDQLDVSPPGGIFTLKDEDNKLKPCVFIGAGIGAATLAPMIHKAVVEDKLKTKFIQCDRTVKSQLFTNAFKKLQSHDNFHFKLFLSQQTDNIPSSGLSGRLNQDHLEELLPEPQSQPNIYVCGPLTFMIDVKRYLKNLGYDFNHIYFEFFGSQVL